MQTGNITIDEAIDAGTGAVQLTGDAITVNQLVSAVAMTVTNAGLFTTAAAGDISLTGPFLQNGAGLNSLAGDVTTTGQDITFNTGITLAGNVTMSTGAGVGNITLSTVTATTAGVQGLTLLAGTGDITAGAIGATRLGPLQVTSVKNATFAAVTAASFTQLAGTGTTTFNGAENYTGNFAFTGNALTINQLVSAVAMTVTNAGLFTTAAAGDISLTGPFLQNGAGLNSLAGDVTTTGQDITFNTGITLAGNVTMISGGGAIILTSEAVSAATLGRDLELNTSTATALANGGEVKLGSFANAGGQFVNDLTINTTPGAGGVAGSLTLTGNILLDDNGAGDPSSFTFLSGGDVIVAANVTIDTEQGNTGPGGAVDFGASKVYGDTGGRDLTIDTRGIGTGGDVTFGLFTKDGGTTAFINDLSVDTRSATNGTIAISKDILVDNNGVDLASVTLAGNVKLGATVQIDTEQGDDAAGGSITLTNASVSATNLGFDLNLITATAAAANGGAVSLGAFNNTAAQFVNDLTINTTPGAGGVAGSLTLTGNISLDHDGVADPGDMTLLGGGDVVVANNIIIDTEQGNANAGGGVNLGDSNVSANLPGHDLTIDTRGVGIGGAVTFGLVDNHSGSFINDFSVDTRSAASGVIGLKNNILVDEFAGDLGSVTLAGDVRLNPTTPPIPPKILIDTEQGNDASGGPIDLSGAVVSATAPNVTLALDSSTAAPLMNGGPVALGTFANAAGQYLTNLEVNTMGGAGGTAGIATLNGDIRLDDSNGAADLGTPATFNLLGVTDVRLAKSVLIDMEQGDDAAGGSLDFTGISISANTLGLDLTLNTATAKGGANGGAVTLGTFTNTAAQFVNDLAIDTSGGGPHLAGTLTLTGNISLDHDGVADPGDMTLLGGGDVVVANNVIIDTEQGNANAGGGVNLGDSNVSANLPGHDLTINTRGVGMGGAVTFGLVDNHSGSFINDFSVDTRSAASGIIGLKNNILVDEFAGDLGSVTLAGDVRLIHPYRRTSSLTPSKETMRRAGRFR